MPTNQKKITAVIPVRKGSERVKDKCTRPFVNTSLLEYKIDSLKKVLKIDRIVVNTDANIAIKMTTKHGVESHRRESYYASSECPANDYFYYLGKPTETDLIAYTSVTAPFIEPTTISTCIQSYTNRTLVS